MVLRVESTGRFGQWLAVAWVGIGESDCRVGAGAVPSRTPSLVDALERLRMDTIGIGDAG